MLFQSLISLSLLALLSSQQVEANPNKVVPTTLSTRTRSTRGLAQAAANEVQPVELEARASHKGHHGKKRTAKHHGKKHHGKGHGRRERHRHGHRGHGHGHGHGGNSTVTASASASHHQPSATSSVVSNRAPGATSSSKPTSSAPAPGSTTVSASSLLPGISSILASEHGGPIAGGDRAATSSVAPAAPATTRAAAVADTKKGLGFNRVQDTAAFSGSVSWVYNWDSAYNYDGSTTLPLPSDVEFVPMLWSTGGDHTPQWADNAQKAIDAGSKWLLGFNEPDLDTQANMSVDEAVEGWNTYMQPFAGKAGLVAPAITNGFQDGSDGKPLMGRPWLDSFLEKCTGCQIDAIAIHIYDAATNEGYFENYINDVASSYGKPVWVTEFAGSGSVADQKTMMSKLFPVLNGNSNIARYSYFGDFEGTFVNADGSATELGQAYIDS